MTECVCCKTSAPYPHPVDEDECFGQQSFLHIIVGSSLWLWAFSQKRSDNHVGVATPLNNFIYHSLLPLELKARGQVQFAI